MIWVTKLSFFVSLFYVWTNHSEHEDPSQRWNQLQPDSGTGSVCSDYVEDVDVENEVVKKIIKPDILTMSNLLNFDEVRLDDLPFYYWITFMLRMMKMTFPPLKMILKIGPSPILTVGQIVSPNSPEGTPKERWCRTGIGRERRGRNYELWVWNWKKWSTFDPSFPKQR